MPLERLSLILIAKNEEAHIADCLKSVSGFVDEMVVVDTGSTDRTRERALECGARLGEYAWAGDFAAARNRSLEMATGDWILMLDADERMDDPGGAQLRRILSESPVTAAAFCLRIESEARHRNSGVWLTHYYPRVFRRRPSVRFEGALHEQVVGPEGPLGLNAPRLPIAIRHLGYAEPGKEASRRDRNLSIIETEALQKPGDVLVKRNLANALLAASKYERALPLFEELAAARLPADLDRQAHWHLGMCCLELRQYDRAREAILGTDHSQGARLLLAEVERRSGHPEGAIPILEELLGRRDPEPETSMDFRADPVHIRIQLAHCERERGYPARARIHLQEALQLTPDSPEVHLSLGLLDEAAGDVGGAMQHLGRAIELHSGLLEAYRARTRLHLVQGNREAARAEVARASSVLPGEPILEEMRTALEVSALPAGARRGSTLSLAMIVRDSAGTVAKAIESVGGLASEVVVVDTGSRDRTPSLCRARGARVLSAPWNDDFAAARNVALKSATSEWVLFLDADEELAGESHPEVRRFMDSGEWDAAEVLIQNRLREDGALHGIAHRYCRLFRRLPGVEFEGRVHEQILPSLLRAGARVGQSDIRILHSGYSLDPAAMRAKQERNLSLLERELADRPGDSFMQFHRGVTLFALGRPAEAGPALRAALAGRSLPVEALALAHIKLAQLALQGSRLDEAQAHLAEARLLRPASPLVRYIAAGIEFLSGRFEPCARELESLLSAGAGGAWEERLDEVELRRDLGNCRYRLCDFAAAAREYRAAAELRPGDAGLHYNLGNALYKGGEFGPALRSFEEALRADPAMDCARENAWQASLRLAESLAAERRDAELAGLSVAGGPVELALLAAGAALRSGEPGRALEILLPREASQPESPEVQFLLAMTLREAGRLDESLVRFARLHTSSEENSVLLTQHALTLLAAGREEEAAVLFARALELDPLLAAPRAA